MMHNGKGSSPIAFWLGTTACAIGVVLHIPVYYSARTRASGMLAFEGERPGRKAPVAA
jgi:hypothetical protein